MPLQNPDMSLVLSSDAKPRLKWTPELHQRFADAVKQLGGAEKATPKALMRVMGIHGLTLYHLKSHLQKYRLGRSQQSQTFHQNKQGGDSVEDEGSHSTNKNCNADAAEEHINDVQVAQALKLQMEVQRKLHQQIEVQKHLQLRIESQGRYLQSVLKKAQETLSGYSACSIEVEDARAQLSQLASMVDSGCTTTSSFSVMTDSDGSALKDVAEEKLLPSRNGYSVESSLTSSESCQKKRNYGAADIDPDSEIGNGGRKRSRSAMEDIDLNCDSLNEFDSGPRGINLNSDGVRLFGSTF